MFAQVPFKVHQLLAEAEAEVPTVQGEDRASELCMKTMNVGLAHN